MKWSWLAALCLCLFLLSACVESASPMEDLEEAGFRRTLSGSTASTCERAQEAFNQEIRDNGGSFTVTVLRFVNLRKGSSEDFTTCQIVEFATEQQAQQYYDLSVAVPDRAFCLSLRGSFVILTNSQEAMEIFGGAFA